MLFLIKKILTAFLLPTGLAIGILTVLAIWMLLKKKKKQTKAGFLLLFLAILIWGAAISLTNNLFFKGLESDFNIPNNPKGDVIILLGSGVNDRAQDLSGIGSPSEETMCRIVTAVRLQKRLNIPIIVSGGQVLGRQPEAYIIKRILTDLNIKKNKILIEDKSRDTFENIMNTGNILKKHNYSNPILVTSAYHMKRSIMTFKRAGINVQPVPVNFNYWQDKKYDVIDFLPKAENLSLKESALREYLGIIAYKIFY